MPPSKSNNNCCEILETYTVASVRIHIERVFARLKTYGILNKLKINLLPYADNITFICCVLTSGLHDKIEVCTVYKISVPVYKIA